MGPILKVEMCNKTSVVRWTEMNPVQLKIHSCNFDSRLAGVNCNLYSITVKKKL